MSMWCQFLLFVWDEDVELSAWAVFACWCEIAGNLLFFSLRLEWNKWKRPLWAQYLHSISFPRLTTNYSSTYRFAKPPPLACISPSLQKRILNSWPLTLFITASMAPLKAAWYLPPHAWVGGWMRLIAWFHGIKTWGPKRSSVPQVEFFLIHMIPPQLVNTINKGSNMSEMLALAGGRDLSWAQHVEKTDPRLIKWWGRWRNCWGGKCIRNAHCKAVIQRMYGCNNMPLSMYHKVNFC